MRILSGAALLSFLSALGLGELGAAAEEATQQHLLVHKAKPERSIQHEVEWKGVIHQTRRESMLSGPRLYSAARAGGAERIVFSWYEIAANTPAARAAVRLEFADGRKCRYEVGGPVYFLSTTQNLSAGSPADVPAGLGHYVAYRIVAHHTAPDANVSPNVKPPTGEGPSTYRLREPEFLCLPVEQWHHDEHFPPSEGSACWLVYGMSPVEHAETISTLDQFGLNTLSIRSANWLCIPASKFQVSAGSGD